MCNNSFICLYVSQHIVCIYHTLPILLLLNILGFFPSLQQLWIKLLQTFYTCILLLNLHLWAELLDCKVHVHSTFINDAKEFFEVIIPFSLPLTVHRIISCFTSSPGLGSAGVLNCSHSSSYVVVYHCGFICISLMTDIKYLSICLWAIRICFMRSLLKTSPYFSIGLSNFFIKKIF